MVIKNGLLFIACGQVTSKEKELGSKVKGFIESKYHVDTFLAEVAHDLVDLNSHIFRNLNICTGFVAILHKRNRINEKYNTSVWINQEIAIIAFLKAIMGKGIPSLILLEDGVEQEGLIKYTIANPLIFKSDEEVLPVIDRWAESQDFSFKDISEQANKWVLESRAKINETLADENPKLNLPYWELAHSLNTLAMSKQWSIKELLSAKENAEVKLSGWPIGITLTRDDAKPKSMNFGLGARIRSHNGLQNDYWELHRNGQFYFMRTLEEAILTVEGKPTNERVVHFATRIRRTAEALLHCQKLYQALRIDPKQPIVFHMNYFRLKERVLTAFDNSRSLSEQYKCEEDMHFYSETLSIKQITDDLKEIVYEITKNLFELFNWFGYQKIVCDGIVDHFLAGKG